MWNGFRFLCAVYFSALVVGIRKYIFKKENPTPPLIPKSNHFLSIFLESNN